MSPKHDVTDTKFECICTTHLGKGEILLKKAE